MVCHSRLVGIWEEVNTTVICKSRMVKSQLAIALLLILACPVVGEPPNILFVYVDDLGCRDMGYSGSDFYRTPHCDQLARQGVIFTNAYSCAANCAPARASLLSGQYTPRHQMYNVGTGPRGKKEHRRLEHIPGTDILREDIVTWAEQLQSAGYRTGHFGKWHLSDDPRDHGFDVNCGGTKSGSPPGGYFAPFRTAVPGLTKAKRGAYLTDLITDSAIEFIRQNKDRRWCAYVSHFAVHTPIQAKPDLVDIHEKRTAGAIHQNVKMAAMIQSVDDGVGRLVQTLRELRLAENTVIIFTSDNGGYGGATTMKPLRGYKGTYYEGGIREPMFIFWPKVIKSGTERHEPVIAVDLFATICAIAEVGLPPNQPCDGVNLIPLFHDEPLGDRDLFWHFPAYLQGCHRLRDQRDPLFRTRPCSIIRSGTWKLHEYFEDGALELYDLEVDPSESRNLAEVKPDQAKRLRRALKQWRQSVGAPVPRQKNPHFDEAQERMAIERRFKRLSQPSS